MNVILHIIFFSKCQMLTTIINEWIMQANISSYNRFDQMPCQQSRFIEQGLLCMNMWRCVVTEKKFNPFYLYIFFQLQSCKCRLLLNIFGFNSYTTISHNLSKIPFYQTVFSMHQGSHNNKCVNLMLLFSRGIRIQK